MDGASSRASFTEELAAEARGGTRTLLLAPLGAGKTHTLAGLHELLGSRSVPCAFLDLFTSGSTPERLLLTLAGLVSPFMAEDRETIEALAREGAEDRQRAAPALLRLFDLLSTRKPSQPFVWLVDEVTEIRSLAYFPELGRIEEPWARVLNASRGAILTSSYLGLAADLFPDFDRRALPGLTSSDLVSLPSLRSDSAAVSSAVRITGGCAATLLPLVSDLRDTRDVSRSLVRLLEPGGTLELICRRHYEVLLMRSRGYAVSKRAAEVVAALPGRRLTDLFPLIGRTAGASRQYLRWLVEVGLLTQTRKRYDFADPLLGLWAALYLGRGRHPTDDEISAAVDTLLAPELAQAVPPSEQPATVGSGRSFEAPPRRVDRFEEID